MDEGKASKTALMTSFFRAYHYAHASPRIVEDSLAGALLSTREREAIEGGLLEGLARRDPEFVRSGADRATLIGFVMRDLPAISIILARARYAEDTLTEAMRNGVAQYVVLGAGLDTFALRRPDLSERLQVFEIDYPATQAFKRQRLQEAGIAVPPNLHFVPADLEREGIGESLSRMPYDRAKPAFFSWLGVTMYLTGDAILKTFRSVRDSAAAGSELVFDYLDRSVFEPENRTPSRDRLFEYVRLRGEPLVSGFDPSMLGAELAPLGFRLLEDLGPKDQEERFFRNRTDGLRPTGLSHIARAAVVQDR
jgi:methyltransferase (TIGR00027 family)